MEKSLHTPLSQRWTAQTAALTIFSTLVGLGTVQAQSVELIPPPPPTVLPANSDNSAEANEPPLPPVPMRPMPGQLPEQAVTQPRQGRPTLMDENWKIEIHSQQSRRPQVDPKTYETYYNSIPFRRSEYLANPSYRHDTAVEMMFGQMRPTVIHRQNTPERVVNPRPPVYDTNQFYQMEYWRNPGRFIQLLPGFGPIVAPWF